ncbi:MAG: cupin fold metalloprotein, WbuC family [Acidobacteria bacterium]|nr:MAG: cupin fold metalloprotein, WbuC family [Acidobacteriota bacterium]
MSTISFPDQDIIEIDEAQIEKLKISAAESPLKRARICLHHSHHDKVQEMVIAFCRGTYNPPHRHQNKSESFHVIEGNLVVVFFDDDGQVTQRIKLGPPGSAGAAFLYRLASTLWHTVVPLSEFVVIHETTSGPFLKSENEVADWAPNQSDQNGVDDFLRRITS